MFSALGATAPPAPPGAIWTFVRSAGVIAIFVGLLSQGKTPVVHGDGLQARDFTYVDNAVQAVLKAGEVPGVSGRVFNVGTGRSVTVLDLVNALNAVLGTNVVPKHGDPRAGDVRFSLAFGTEA